MTIDDAHELKMQIDMLQQKMQDLCIQFSELHSSTEMLVEQAATLAIKRAFLHLGVNVDDATDLQRFRDDLRFGGVFRSTVQKGFFAIIATICGSLGYSILIIIKERFGIHD